MNKYVISIQNKIKNVILSCVIVSLVSGCSFYMPDNTNQPEGSVNMSDNNILTTDKNEADVIPEATPTIVPSQTDIPNANAVKWIERYKDNGYDGDKVLMSFEKIDNFNKVTFSKSDAMIDIFNVAESLSSSKVASMIESMSVPDQTRYDRNNNAISQSKVDEILDNRNLSVLYNIESISPQLGIIVQRTALRSLPTDMPFFSDPGTQYYDRIQETEVIVGSGVWILHESKNGEYYFVQTFNYSGWVASRHIAIADSVDEWNAFANPEKFATVKATLYTTKDSYTKLDMGVKLPLAGISRDGYKVKLPGRNPDGMLYYDYIVLGGDIACEGYMPFTMNNFYKQAFKYEGFMYGWGGSYDSVDCSGFVSAVMRVFGFELPRNVSQQRDVVGEVISVKDTGKDNIDSVLDSIDLPAAVYKPGHVMLYLGKYDGSHYVIHSPTGGRVVCAEVLDTSSTSIVSINKFN